MNARRWSRAIQLSREKGAYDQHFRSDLSRLLDGSGGRLRISMGRQLHRPCRLADIGCLLQRPPSESRRRRALTHLSHLSRLRRAAA